jgi:hypothetical protein
MRAPLAPTGWAMAPPSTFDEVPDRGRQVEALVRDLPVVEVPAELLHRTVEEGLFLGAQLRGGEGEETVPVRVAAEELRVPPHGPGLHGLALGFRHGRHDVPKADHERPRDQPLPQGGELLERGEQEIEAPDT